MKFNEKLIRVAFVLLSVGYLCFCYGVVVGKYQVFPYSIIKYAINAFAATRDASILEKFYYKRADLSRLTTVDGYEQAWQGVNLVVHFKADDVISVKVVDMDGVKIHEWIIDWFEIWPDAGHVPDRFMPRARPGTHVHGAVLLENGDLVFNFEHLGLVRLDRQGEVVWRLPYQTHHSIHRHTDGNLWVCGQKEHTQSDERFPNRLPPFTEYMLLEVTPDGEILAEWSVAELLRNNGREGLLYLGSLENQSTVLPETSDVLHLNDVEPFPATFEEGFFKHDDILVSLRNINTIFVFNRESGEIKFISTGHFVRQHDPDFMDGNSFSVFDNNNVAEENQHSQSRIVIVSVTPDTETYQIFFQGNEQIPFYTDIMGKHQWLPNGNLLITESRWGRAFELNREREIVWEYNNDVGREAIGLVEEVRRLPIEYASLFQQAAAVTQ